MGGEGGPTRSDDLDRATDALRESLVPPGPPANLVGRTLAAVNRGPRGTGTSLPAETTLFQRIRAMNLITKIAAAFVLAACGAALLMLVTRRPGHPPLVGAPADTTRPSSWD